MLSVPVAYLFPFGSAALPILSPDRYHFLQNIKQFIYKITEFEVKPSIHWLLICESVEWNSVHMTEGYNLIHQYLLVQLILCSECFGVPSHDYWLRMRRARRHCPICRCHLPCKNDRQSKLFHSLPDTEGRISFYMSISAINSIFLFKSHLPNESWWTFLNLYSVVYWNKISELPRHLSSFSGLMDHFGIWNNSTCAKKRHPKH